MTVIAVCNHKGGTGKTTSVIHIAAALGMSGRRTLVVDLDPQSFLTRMLGVEEPKEEHSSVALFSHDVCLREVPVVPVRNFDLLPSSSLLTKHMRRLNKPTDVFWAREALRDGVDYDFIIFDTAAAVTVYSLNALVASDFVLIPVTPEYQPVLGAEQTFQTVELVRERLNPDLSSPAFLFTQVDARKNSHHMFRRYMRGKYGGQVMRAIIRTSSALAETKSDGSTVFENDPYSRGARDYANATDELLTLMNPDLARSRPESPHDDAFVSVNGESHEIEAIGRGGGGELSEEEAEYLRSLQAHAHGPLRGEAVNTFWQPIREFGP
ncbi:MAG: ParA family protein [Rhodothermales bacterium]